MTAHTFTDAELAAHNAAIRSAALAEAAEVVENGQEFVSSRDNERSIGPRMKGSLTGVAYAAAIRALAATPPGMVCVKRAELDLIGQLSQTSPTRTLGEASDNLAKVQGVYRAMLSAGKA